MQDEWFKVEILQDYSGEDASLSLNSWLKGNKKHSLDLIKETNYSKWIEDCQKKLKQGVKLVRIHAVEEPYTPYIEWEINHYKLINIPKCGEVVYLINRLELKSLKIPPGDSMVFNKKRAAVNTYNDHSVITHQTLCAKMTALNVF